MAATKKTTAKESSTTTNKTAESKSPKDETVEEIKVAGGQLVEKVKELIQEGNVRKIIVKKDGKSMLEIPMTWAVVGVALAPVFAALGVLAALISECTLEVEREK